MNNPNYQTNLLDLIIEQQQNQQLRQLQNDLPAELRDGWELIFEHLGGKKRYYCVNFDHNIITNRHISKHQAIEEAYDYALLFELLPVAILQIRHPGRWLPARYRQMLIEHERRTHVQTPATVGAKAGPTASPVHA